MGNQNAGTRWGQTAVVSRRPGVGTPTDIRVDLRVARFLAAIPQDETLHVRPVSRPLSLRVPVSNFSPPSSNRTPISLLKTPRTSPDSPSIAFHPLQSLLPHFVVFLTRTAHAVSPPSRLLSYRSAHSAAQACDTRNRRLSRTHSRTVFHVLHRQKLSLPPCHHTSNMERRTATHMHLPFIDLHVLHRTLTHNPHVDFPTPFSEALRVSHLAFPSQIFIFFSPSSPVSRPPQPLSIDSLALSPQGTHTRNTRRRRLSPIYIYIYIMV